MAKFKPEVNKDIVLKPMTDRKTFELMFLPENDGFFRMGSETKPVERLRYMEFLEKASGRWMRYVIEYKGKLAGFILAAGEDCRLVGGIFPEFQRKGIYSIARNTLINSLNGQGVYIVTSSVDESNDKMAAFLSGVSQTKYHERLSINHFDPDKPVAVIKGKQAVRRVDSPIALYAIKESAVIDGDDVMSFYPSPQLAFKALWYKRTVSGIGNKSSLRSDVYRLNKGDIKKMLPPREQHGLTEDAHYVQPYLPKTTVKYELDGNYSFTATMGGFSVFVPHDKDTVVVHSPKQVNIRKN